MVHIKKERKFLFTQTSTIHVQLPRNWVCPRKTVRNLPAVQESQVQSPGPGEENGNPLQYSCLENSMGRRAWRATVCGSQRVRHEWAANTHTQEGQAREYSPVLNWVIQDCMGDTASAYRPESGHRTQLAWLQCVGGVFQSVWWFRYMCLNVYLYLSLFKGFKSVYKETYSKVESITNKVGQGKKELRKEGQD